MKKFLALLLTLCMLAGCCAAFAEGAPAAEQQQPMTEEEAMLQMIDGVWMMALGTCSEYYNQGVTVIESVLSAASEILNNWFEGANERYATVREGLAETVVRTMHSVNDTMEKGRYIAQGDEAERAAQEEMFNNLTASIQQVIESVTEIIQTAQEEAVYTADSTQTRAMEAKDGLIDSTAETVNNVADIIGDLFFVFTGAADSKTKTRLGEAAQGEDNQFTATADEVQSFLDGVVEYLYTLKDVEPIEDAVETLPAAEDAAPVNP